MGSTRGFLGLLHVSWRHDIRAQWRQFLEVKTTGSLPSSPISCPDLGGIIRKKGTETTACPLWATEFLTKSSSRYLNLTAWSMGNCAADEEQSICLKAPSIWEGCLQSWWKIKSLMQVLDRWGAPPTSFLASSLCATTASSIGFSKTGCGKLFSDQSWGRWRSGDK